MRTDKLASKVDLMGKEKKMNLIVTGHCKQCGAPIYTPSVWMGIIPPPNQYSCGCFPRQITDTTNSYHEVRIPTTKAVNPKIEIIKTLEKYQGDTTNNDDYAAFEKVIEWFINCTPDYKGNQS